ncbi:MAG: UbiX family flavin prenyltransferase [Eggerthellaceae bacterium]
MNRLVVGITGASGTPLACRFVHQLKQFSDVEVNLVASKSARLTAQYEAPQAFEQMLDEADVIYDNARLGEAIASGTFKTQGMVIIPCSMKTIAGIASGYTDNLVLRAADVTLKEQRKLVLVARETPLNTIHLRNLESLASIPGVSILPPMMTYYHHPKSIEDMEDQIIGKIFDRFDLDYPPLSRWKG